MEALRDLELRHLHALLAVAEERSFGRGATRLGYTQSAISQQIAALERVVGGAVFDRPGGPRPVELTPLGQVLCEHARTLLDRLRLIDDDLARLKAGESGRIVVGTFQSVSVRLLPAIIGQLRAERPKVDVRLVTIDDDDGLTDAVLSGELDVAFCLTTQPIERLEIIALFDDPYVLVAPRGRERSPVALATVGEVPMIGQSGSACQLPIRRSLVAAGISPDYVFVSDDNAAVQAMVRAGMGYAVMPTLAVDRADVTLDFLELVPPVEPRRISLALRDDRTRSAALDRFVELSIEVAGEVAELAAAR